LVNFSGSYFKIPASVLNGPAEPGTLESTKFLTFDDSLYQLFMTEVLLSLEPRKIPSESMIFNTNVETHEMFFVNSGSIDIGYELNNKTRYVMRLTKGGVVGAYNCTFDKKTIFIYKCKSEFSGYTIRKLNWLRIMKNDDYHFITEVVKNNVRTEYLIKIKNRVLLEQSKYIKLLKGRADTNQIVGLINLRTFMPILANVKNEL
jgi:hypothetical protein